MTSRNGNNSELATLEKDWQPTLRADGSACYTHIEPTTQQVYWTPSFKPEPLPQQRSTFGEQPSGQNLGVAPQPFEAHGSSSRTQEDRGEGSSSMNMKRLIEVQVKVIPHVWSTDEWRYLDARGAIKLRVRDAWTRRPELNLGRVWALETRSHIYYMSQNLSNDWAWVFKVVVTKAESRRCWFLHALAASQLHKIHMLQSNFLYNFRYS